MEIIKHPATILGQRAKPVPNINTATRQLLDAMKATLEGARGQGLAAPQVGALRRIIIVDVHPHPYMELINPEILSMSEAELTALEGCLSIPGLAADVRRAERVRVTAQDRLGRRFWLDAEGELARCLQHEIDHLDGILMLDRAIAVYELNRKETENRPEA